MLVPRYWAEGRAQHRQNSQQVTVRRFGWSQTSQDEAQANAEQRAQAALQRMIAGEKLPKRETKVPYNGADGMPIREEIVSEHGDVVVTRNVYGARCLNTLNVLFVDVDIQEGFPSLARLTFWLLWIVAIVFLFKINFYSALLIVACILLLFIKKESSLMFRPWVCQLLESWGITTMSLFKNRVRRFLSRHSDWHMRLYQTPAGMRVLVTHRTFDPNETAVQECFKALKADPVYARMCRKQQCFRARVSPKPWRMGIQTALKMP